MSKKPPIVAELGRPETPEETAARKAESSRRYRSSKTFQNLVVALIASLALVLVMWLVVLRPDPTPADPIDVDAASAEANVVLQSDPVVPVVPEGWEANAAEVRVGNDGIPKWYIGYITPNNGFVTLNQASEANPTWLSNLLQEATPTGSTTIDGLEWEVYDQREHEDVGNVEFAMSIEVDDDWYVLFGTAGDQEFTEFAQAVSQQIQQ